MKKHYFAGVLFTLLLNAFNSALGATTTLPEIGKRTLRGVAVRLVLDRLDTNKGRFDRLVALASPHVVEWKSERQKKKEKKSKILIPQSGKLGVFTVVSKVVERKTIKELGMQEVLKDVDYVTADDEDSGSTYIKTEEAEDLDWIIDVLGSLHPFSNCFVLKFRCDLEAFEERHPLSGLTDEKVTIQLAKKLFGKPRKYPGMLRTYGLHTEKMKLKDGFVFVTVTRNI